MTFCIKLEFSDKRRINYELLKRQKLKKQNNVNLGLEIEI